MLYKYIIFTEEVLLFPEEKRPGTFYGEMQKALKELHGQEVTTVLFRKSQAIDRLAGKFSFDRVLDSKSPEDALKEFLCDEHISASGVLYIGNSIRHREEVTAAGADFGMAMWNGASIKHVRANGYFTSPREMVYTLSRMKDPLLEVPWLKWAMELQFIAQAGITYSKDKFDLERFHRLREIAAEMLSMQTGLSVEKVTTLFCNETGFQTPKLDSRAAIFEEGRILLVRESDGRWSLPGGWVDVNQSIGENTVKEVKEEAGLDVVPVKLIALQDRKLHNLPYYGYGICKALVQCEVIGGEFVPNTETTESRFFLPDELPVLSEDKITAKQIHLCFEAYQSENWQTLLD